MTPLPDDIIPEDRELTKKPALPTGVAEADSVIELAKSIKKDIEESGILDGEPE